MHVILIPHFTEENFKAQGARVIGSRSKSYKVVNPGFKSRQSTFSVFILF